MCAVGASSAVLRPCRAQATAAAMPAGVAPYIAQSKLLAAQRASDVAAAPVAIECALSRSTSVRDAGVAELLKSQQRVRSSVATPDGHGGGLAVRIRA
jgi:hypothetical protein